MPQLPARFSLYLLLFVTMLLAACGARPQPATETATPFPVAQTTRPPTLTPTATEQAIQGTITIWHAWEELQRPALQRIVYAFQTLYPDIQFDVQYIPALDLKGSFEAASEEGNAPAILIGPAEWGPDLFQKGLIADLSTLASPGLLDSLTPAARQEGVYQSRLVGIPQNIRGVVLYRNRKIIPQAPATWLDLVESARAATTANTIGAMLDRSLFYAGGHLYGLGGSLMDADGNPTFNDAKGLAWVGLLKSFTDAGPADYFSDADINLFKEGRLGIFVGDTANLRALQEAIGADYLAIDPWPITADGALSGFVQSENIYLGSQAQGQARDVAWLFIDYFMKPESQAALLDAGAIPAVKELPKDSQFRDPLISQAMAALAGGSPYPVQPSFALYANPLDHALRSIFDGGTAPPEALQIAADEIKADLAASRAESTPTP
jgi:ABC-type glycerol-3-phosphate transport system substrate-binding protein